MDLKTGEISAVAEWDAYDENYHQMRVDGDSLVYWESCRNEETSLHLYDLSAEEELLVLPVTATSDADCSGDRLVWCQWNVPILHIYDMASGKSVSWEIPDIEGEIKLLGDRQLMILGGLKVMS